MQFDFKQAVLVVKDGTGTPNTHTVVFGEGTFSWTRTRAIKFTPNRGVISTGTVRTDDEVPMEVSISALLNFMIKDSSETITLYEILFGENGASAYVSTGDDCEPYAVNLEFTWTPVCVATTKAEKLVFPKFMVEKCTPDMKGIISFNGKCKATKPTITRV